MSADLNDSLNKILSALNNFTEKVSNLDARLDNLEKNFDLKFKKIENKFQQKASLFELNELKEKIVQFEKDKQEQDCLAIMKESFIKRFNILIHGLTVISGNIWEKSTKTLEHVHKFMKDGLHIFDPKPLPLADYHRLPQQPIFKFGRKTTRPIIIKLTNTADKRKIFGNLKNLKSYNESRKALNLKPVFVTEHLPKKFQQEQKLLLPEFRKARRINRKTVWRAEKGHYVLYVDGIKVQRNHS